jgi:ABC-type uncharacterized transport system fused permease/ATPase subunit
MILKNISEILRLGASKKAMKYVAIISLLSIFSVICLVLMNKIYGSFYDALVQKNYPNAMKYLICHLTVMALIAISDGELKCNQRFFTLHFREKIYNFYNIDVLDDKKSEYSCQRMSQDLLQFPWQFIELFALFFHSILLIPSFLYLTITGGIGVSAILGCIILAIASSLISRIIGKPVVALQYKQESLEARLRRELIQELEKNNKTLPNLKDITINYASMSRKERWLTYFKNGYDRVAKCIPYFILVPKYFGGQITLGTMVQSGTALSKLITEISFFVSNVDKIVEFRATVNRVSEINEIKKEKQ